MLFVFQRRGGEAATRRLKVSPLAQRCALGLGVALGATVAARAADVPEPPALCAQTPTPAPDGFGGSVTVVVAGAAPRCGLALRVHHRHATALAGPDGTVYVAEQPERWEADDTDAGAVDVFAPGGAPVRRITAGIAGPTALALDERGRLLVANSGSVLNGGSYAVVPPTVTVYDRTAAPVATYPMPPRAFMGVLAVAGNGDLFVDTGQDAVTRVRPGDATPLRRFVTPHQPTVVDATIYPLDVRRLRLRGAGALVALFTGGNEPPFFTEWSLTDGRLIRRVAVPDAQDFAVDGAGRVVVATSNGKALVFPPGATAPTDRWDTTSEVVATAADANGNVWFQGHDELVGLDGTGRRVAAYGLARMGAVALVGAPARL